MKRYRLSDASRDQIFPTNRIFFQIWSLPATGSWLVVSQNFKLFGNFRDCAQDIVFDLLCAMLSSQPHH